LEKSNYLGNGPRDEKWCVLGVVRQHSLCGVEETKVGSAIYDDSQERNSKSAVPSHEAIGFEDLAEAVCKSGEFAFSAAFPMSAA